MAVCGTWAALCLVLCSVVRAQDPPTGLLDARHDLHYAKGVLAYNQKRYAEAEDLLRQALQARPDDAAAALWLGATLNRLGRHAEALEQLTQARTLDPEQVGVDYEVGVAHFGLKQYGRAVKALERAVEQEPERAMAHYYLGLAQHRRGAYRSAVPQLQRAAELAPQLAPVARFYTGVGYYRQGYLVQARDAFTQVLDAEPDPALAESARRFLDQIAAVLGGQKPYFAQVGGMFQHDSNVVLATGNSVLPSGISHKGDDRWVLFASAGRNARPSGWGMDGVYRLYQSFHQELSAFDVQNHDVDLGVDYGWPRARARLGYGFGLTRVESDTYLRQHRLTPSLSLQRGEQTWAFRYEVAFLDFDNVTSAPGNDARDGINHLLGVDWARPVAGSGQLRLGYAFNNRLSGSNASEDDWAYQGHALSAAVGLAWRLHWRAGLVTSYELQRYGHPNQFSPTGKKRDDEVAQVQVSASRDIGRHAALAAQYLYVRDASNVSSFDYTRNIFSVVASGAF